MKWHSKRTCMTNFLMVWAYSIWYTTVRGKAKRKGQEGRLYCSGQRPLTHLLYPTVPTHPHVAKKRRLVANNNKKSPKWVSAPVTQSKSDVSDLMLYCVFPCMNYFWFDRQSCVPHPLGNSNSFNLNVILPETSLPSRIRLTPPVWAADSSNALPSSVQRERRTKVHFLPNLVFCIMPIRYLGG